jgi:type II secretory pathway predicted ATPase ExeA
VRRRAIAATGDVGTGKTVFRLAYARSWEMGVRPMRTFTFDVNAL